MVVGNGAGPCLWYMSHRPAEAKWSSTKPTGKRGDLALLLCDRRGGLILVNLPRAVAAQQGIDRVLRGLLAAAADCASPRSGTAWARCVRAHVPTP